MAYSRHQLNQMSRSQLINAVLSHQDLIMSLARDTDRVPRQQMINAVDYATQKTIEDGNKTLETLIIPFWQASTSIKMLIERLTFAIAAGARGEMLQKAIAGIDEELIVQWVRFEKLASRGAQLTGNGHSEPIGQFLIDLQAFIPDLIKAIRACEAGDSGEALRMLFDEWGTDNLKIFLADFNEQIARWGRPPNKGKEYFGDTALRIREELYPGQSKANRDRVIDETIKTLQQSEHSLAEAALDWWHTITHTASGKRASSKHCRNELSRQIAEAKKRRIQARKQQ